MRSFTPERPKGRSELVMLKSPGEYLTMNVELIVSPEGIYVFLGEREMWIELSDMGNLVVHAYAPNSDMPTSIEVTENEKIVTVDESDRLRL